MRLRYGYFITCTERGEERRRRGRLELHCTYDPATRGGNAPDGRKVKATIHWVSAAHAVDAEVRLYDTLFTKEDPDRRSRGPGFHGQPESEFARSADRRKLEPPARRSARRSATSSSGWAISAWIPTRRRASLVFNRTVALKDTWAKIEKRGTKK